VSKYIIIGGVAGGATAAARLRRLDEKAEIILLERGEHISYANCGLPYYAGGIIKERSKLFVMTPARFKATLAVDVRTGHEAVAIQPTAKTVKIVERATGRTYVESYDALVLSPGAEPIRPSIPGIDDDRIFTLRTVPDIDAIKERMDARRPERAIVVGAGFIGLEMAENLRERGIFVTIVEALDQVMNVIDFEMAAIVHQHIKAKGVELYLSDAVAAFTKDGERIVAKLRSGKILPADMVILSIGVKPETSLARAAGLALDARGYIVTDAHMRTSDPAIYAVGDAVTVKNPITGKPSTVPLAGPANKQARIAADNIAGAGPREYRGAIGTAIAKVFDLTVACTGLAEKTCEKDAIPYRAVVVHPSSHAGYYPGAKPFSLKLVFDPSGGRILGAQAVGYEGVDKRIDVIAAFITTGASISALNEFEHAYAPPFSSAKDPVNYAGFVAENLIEGQSQQVGWKDVEPLRKKGAFILDARTPEEFALGRIEGAVNIPNTEIRTRMGQLPRDRFILVYCGVGIRGYLAERILKQNGFGQVANLAGGWKTYQAATAVQSNEGVYRSGTGVASSDAREPVAYAEGSGAPENMVLSPGERIDIDACGLQCPGPIIRLKVEADKASVGARLVVRASDPGFARDALAWCHLTGNTLESMEDERGTFVATIVKTGRAGSTAEESAQTTGHRVSGNEATLIVFSDDLDKALASFVIANGAAAVGKKVTMFFTFWGLSVIKRREKVHATKDFMGRMFSWMLPRNSKKLSLSKMNCAGMGPGMMRGRMKAKNIDQLETMIETALRAGISMTACQMSMDIMGVVKEELIDGVELGGVASYLESASSAAVNLFI
jgi:NADPH-dependent 2,4-dienoyl-CoA reductase/sulfur reductase-like enzyme/peroxiredoxin family protein/rhodanese-related sulfurtransferase/TusA-related sulfurtransferase